MKNSDTHPQSSSGLDLVRSNITCLVAVALFAFTFPASDLLLEDWGVLSVIVFRNISAFLLLLLMWIVSEGFKPLKSADWLKGLWVGGIGFGIGSVDRLLMRDGMKLMRKIGQTPALQSIIESELSPGTEVKTDEDFDEFVRANSWTVYHQCGTCRMGTDPKKSVVDERLKVHGIIGLRVVDASIFPSVPTGNTNGPTIAVLAC